MKKYYIYLKRKIDIFFHRYINGSKGVISLFLAILMVPFATISGALINAARFNSAVEIFDEALCNASNSTLGTYDEFLRNRFGLLAMYQNVASGGTGYDAQALISDTFKYYMEQNLKTLSNTYESSELDAHGVYPLADTDVLLSQIYESGKYSVPAKLVIDGLSIDDIINKLTESTKVVTTIFDTMSAGTDMLGGFSDCQNKINALESQINSTRDAKSKYEGAYNNFKNAIDNYNKTIDELNEEIKSVQNEIDQASKKVDECKEKVDDEKKKESVANILDQIEELKNQKDEDGNLIDNSIQIKKIEDDNEDTLKDYNKAKKALADAEQEFNNVKTKINGITDKYRERLDNQKNQVRNQKEEYINKIDSYAKSVLDTGNAVLAAQNSITQTANSGVKFAGNLASTVYEQQKNTTKKQIEDLKKDKESAEKRGDTEAAAELDKEIAESQNKKTEIDNNNTFNNAMKNAESEGISQLNEFANAEYGSKYEALYSNIVALKGSVQEYVIPDDDIKMTDAASYFLSNLSEPISSDKVQKMGEDFAIGITKASFFSVIKAIASFIRELFKIDLLYNWDLTAKIDKNLYSGIGGLPSEKDRSDGSQFSLKSEYADADSAKSDYYKNLLGKYSNNPGIAGSADANVTLVEQILSDIETIVSCASEEWHWYNVFEKLKTLIGSIIDIVVKMTEFSGNILKVLATSVYQKALLVGYIGYNIPNRTTYGGSALTGASYSLPNQYSAKQGYAFYGAEAEYIMYGNSSETINQTMVFWQAYLFRFVYDLAFIAANPEVDTIAGTAGAATFGIGAVIVYVLYFLAEPFVDTVVLVNGGNVPIVKTKIYLTPTGFMSLIEEFVKVKMTNAQKSKIYDSARNALGGSKESFPEDYETAEKLASNGKVVDSITFDYTKTIMLIMMLFNKSDVMVNRLADVIEMEAMYNAKTQIDSYAFDLDKSYTYLRASGKFSANEFIKISDSSSFLSPERIVYRGY